MYACRPTHTWMGAGSMWVAGYITCRSSNSTCLVQVPCTCLRIIGLSTALPKVHVGENLNHSGSAAKVRESLVHLTGGVPKLGFRVGEVAR